MKPCSIAPSFSHRAYVVSFFLQTDEQIQLFTLSLLSLTPEDVVKDVGDLEEHIAKERQDQDVHLLDSCLIIPATFSSLFELKKEFWDNPTVPYSGDVRQKAFIPLLSHPTLYQLLVLPYYFDEKTNIWQFAASLPLPAQTPQETITRFMMTSDAVVDPRAQYAAIYDLATPIRFNWKTKTAESVIDISEQEDERKN